MAMFHSLPSIHVKHQKNTAELESVIMPVPAEVTISMSQHIGAPCKPVVKVGDTVKRGDVLCIIEAMKLMNDIECDFDGVVSEVLVKNGETVEYGQPLFRIA